MSNKKVKPEIKFKVWSATPAHESIDTRLHVRLVELLKAEGFDAEYRGDWDILELCEGKKALVGHHGRGGYRYPFTPAQTDAESIIIDMHSGALPLGIKVYVTAHRHTTAGSVEHKGIKVVRCPAFVSFIPYQRSLTIMTHILPDVGAWIIIITKDRRIRLQEWLYPPFLYHDVDNKIIISNEAQKSYVNPDYSGINEPLVSLLKEAEKVILVIADLHVGETQAVVPPTFKDMFGHTQTVQMNEANKQLYGYWKHLCDTVKKFLNVDEVWLVGDAFGGAMSVKFEKYRKMTLGNIEDQLYATVELLKLLNK